MSYTEVKLTIDPLDPFRDVLLYHLNELGFESHQETESGLISYIPATEFNQPGLESCIEQVDAQISYETRVIEQENWNQKWEEAFEPVVVNDQCVICASFHKVDEIPYKILIDPKMAFGTGHHETTLQVSRQLFEEELAGKSLLDMGCGTAVLAILAEKLGAKEIDAIDIDEWAYRNSVENIKLNNCVNISCFQGGSEVLRDRLYSVILANINKNVLLEQLPLYSERLEKQGIILLSGFYSQDIADVVARGQEFGLSFASSTELNDWAMIKMCKD